MFAFIAFLLYTRICQELFKGKLVLFCNKLFEILTVPNIFCQMMLLFVSYNQPSEVSCNRGDCTSGDNIFNWRTEEVSSIHYAL